MRSPLVDELTFGEWWLRAEWLNSDLDASTPAEREFITRSLVAYVEIDRTNGYRFASEMRRSLTAWLDKQSHGSGSTILGRLAAGGAVASGLWHVDADLRPTRRSPGAEKVTLMKRETDDLVASIAEAAEITVRDVNALGVRLTRKWALGIGKLSHTVSKVSTALGVSDPVSTMDVPRSLSRHVDQAMFVPLPRACGTVMLVSAEYQDLSARDPFAASRLLLAVAHEVAGHSNDFRDLVPANPERVWLDRELLEGWGIVAERRLSGLGEDEHALYLLYKVKRLLPLAHHTLNEPSWARVRHTIETVWPGFFTSATTSVLRRATGSHARGVVRVRRALDVYGEEARFGVANPWRSTPKRSAH
ncbi:hypothetical protein ACPPVQ_18615 [Diaminobutyricibacter sp. McL0618]|uniref:hypothetical protein n=1 Tax=Leifsonia sp. McL0618 TaxID=3415677 RepID=UPI003CF29CEA